MKKNLILFAAMMSLNMNACAMQQIADMEWMAKESAISELRSHFGAWLNQAPDPQFDHYGTIAPEAMRRESDRQLVRQLDLLNSPDPVGHGGTLFGEFGARLLSNTEWTNPTEDRVVAMDLLRDLTKAFSFVKGNGFHDPASEAEKGNLIHGFLNGIAEFISGEYQGPELLRFLAVDPSESAAFIASTAAAQPDKYFTKGRELGQEITHVRTLQKADVHDIRIFDDFIISCLQNLFNERSGDWPDHLRAFLHGAQ